MIRKSTQPNPPRKPSLREKRQRAWRGHAVRDDRAESRSASLRRLRLARKRLATPGVPGDAYGRAWYLLAVRAGHEIAVAVALGDAGFAGFSPVELVEVKPNSRAPKPGHIRRPFIASLCLVGFEPRGEAWGRVVGPPGVRDPRLGAVLGTLGHDLRPERLRFDAFRWLAGHHLQAGVTRGAEAQARRRAHLAALIGHRVHVIEGLFGGHAGTATALEGDVFNVDFRIFNHDVTAPVPLEWVREAADA